LDIFLKILTILLSLVSIWLGLKKVDVSKYAQIFLAALDAILILVATIQLGWLGLGLVMGANIIAAIIWSIRLAIKKDHLLTSASAQSTVEKKELEGLYDQLPNVHKVFKAIGPIDRARLLFALSRRGRNIDEMSKIAVPVALVWYVHKPELEAFVDQFDRLLRLWGKSADEAMSVADMITAASQHSAATFDEMMEALVAFKEAPPPSSSEVNNG